MRILEIVEATDKTAVFVWANESHHHWTPKNC